LSLRGRAEAISELKAGSAIPMKTRLLRFARNDKKLTRKNGGFMKLNDVINRQGGLKQ
jgi:hypothetical protein